MKLSNFSADWICLNSTHDFIKKITEQETDNKRNILTNLITTSSIKVSKKKLSPTQKTFNRLTKSLQQEKDLLKTWSETHDALRMRYTQRILPLLQEMDKLRLRALIQLDQWYDHKSLTKRQKEKLFDFIQDLAEICVTCDDSGQAEAIYDRYNEINFNETKKEHYAELKSEIEDQLGVELGEDFDFESDTAFSDFIGAVKNKAEQEKSRTQKQSKKRKTTTKQDQSELLESQSIKEIFRQLTKVLHPDREMDEKEKIRKSELMQRANISYKKQDLFSLLELQFEIEQANQETFNHLSSERLAVYNRLLQRQQHKIKGEINFLKQKIGVEINIPFFYEKPEQAQYLLKKQQHDLEDQMRSLHQDLETFSEIKSLKRWINALKIQKTHYPDEMFFEFL